MTSDIKRKQRTWLVLLLSLGVVMLALFRPSFRAENILANNDGPLGAISSDASSAPGVYTGFWNDLNWLGSEQPSPAPTISVLSHLILGNAVNYSKFYVPISLMILGFCTYFFFRQLRFGPAVSVICGLVAALNGNMLSNACWGQFSRPLSLAMTFLALGLLQDLTGRRGFPKIILAGLAVGMAVMEGFDVGAIFSLYVAAFCIFGALVERPSIGALGKGVITLLVIVAFSALISAQTLTTLISTQIKGIAGLEQTEGGREKRWDEATQWSTPKIETLRLLIPGSHGYRMNSPDGGQYWGRVGQSPGWGTDINGDGKIDRAGMSRFSGSGEYAGVLVVLLAIYSIALTIRKKQPVFSDRERKFIWFWSALGVISLLLAWGRFAPFYEIVYQIPYASTIRNPMKFMHPFHMILIILFGYGLQALYRQYVETVVARSGSFSEQWKKFWATASSFDRKWVIGCVMAFGIAVLSWLIFNSSAKSFQKHLVDFAGLDPGLASTTAKFSIREVGLFVMFLALSIGAVAAVMSGWFSGTRAKWAGFLLGTILVVDLARASKPWIIYYDYKYKYATNPVIEKLRAEPYKHRVTMFAMAFPQDDYFSSLYSIEWHQQHFQFYNIQSLDVVQMSREPVDYAAFAGMTSGAFPYRNGAIDPKNIPILPRYWQLTNTRFILGPAGLAEGLNGQLKTESFQVPMRFDLAPKSAQIPVRQLEDFTVAPNANGKYALIEFTNALPRAKLYSNWQVSTNQAAILEQLKSPEFDPHKEVIVSASTPIPAPISPDTDPGMIEFSSYAPKKVVLRANAITPSILLLNDKYSSNWKVTVDGNEAPLLQANFIMRGVYLTPGEHEVIFSFEPPITGLYVSLAAVAIGLLLCGYLIVSGRKDGTIHTQSAEPGK